MALTALAFLGKLLGAAIPARVIGHSSADAGLIGMAMNARGAVGLIIAGIALEAGLFNSSGESVLVENLFSAVVIVVITTTVLSPIGMRIFLKRIYLQEDGHHGRLPRAR